MDSSAVNRQQHATSVELADSDEFRMYYCKILPCRKRYSHDWSDCMFTHVGEKVQRRCPRKHNYLGFMCPDIKKNSTCPRGTSCCFAHNPFEYWLHPTRYRTEVCAYGSSCKRPVCFFAHTTKELRNPTKVLGPPSNLHAKQQRDTPDQPPTIVPRPSTRQHPQVAPPDLLLMATSGQMAAFDLDDAVVPSDQPAHPGHALPEPMDVQPTSLYQLPGSGMGMWPDNTDLRTDVQVPSAAMHMWPAGTDLRADALAKQDAGQYQNPCSWLQPASTQGIPPSELRPASSLPMLTCQTPSATALISQLQRQPASGAVEGAAEQANWQLQQQQQADAAGGRFWGSPAPTLQLLALPSSGRAGEHHAHNAQQQLTQMQLQQHHHNQQQHLHEAALQQQSTALLQQLKQQQAQLHQQQMQLSQQQQLLEQHLQIPPDAGCHLPPPTNMQPTTNNTHTLHVPGIRARHSPALLQYPDALPHYSMAAGANAVVPAGISAPSLSPLTPSHSQEGQYSTSPMVARLANGSIPQAPRRLVLPF